MRLKLRWTRVMEPLQWVIAKWYESTASHIWVHLLTGIGSQPLKPAIGVRVPVGSPVAESLSADMGVA